MQQIRKSTTGRCLHCKKNINISDYLRQEVVIEHMQKNCMQFSWVCAFLNFILFAGDTNNLKQIDDLHDLLKDTFYKHHKRFERCYLLYISYYTLQSIIFPKLSYSNLW